MVFLKGEGILLVSILWTWLYYSFLCCQLHLTISSAPRILCFLVFFTRSLTVCPAFFPAWSCFWLFSFANQHRRRIRIYLIFQILLYQVLYYLRRSLLQALHLFKGTSKSVINSLVYEAILNDLLFSAIVMRRFMFFKLCNDLFIQQICLLSMRFDQKFPALVSNSALLCIF